VDFARDGTQEIVAAAWTSRVSALGGENFKREDREASKTNTTEARSQNVYPVRDSERIAHHNSFIIGEF